MAGPRTGKVPERPAAPLSGAPTDAAFDALLFLSFGGPDGPTDVMPFLENVTRGRGVPRERLEDVAQHYLHFGGVSPINRLNRDMIDAVREGLSARGRDLPVYFGNRNWHPMVEDTLAEMYRAGHRRILVFPTSAWGGYSGCRQYHEDIDRALHALARLEPTSTAPDSGLVLRKLPQYWSEPGFLDAGADAVRRAAATLPESSSRPRLVFTAHSVPISADESSGPEGVRGLYSGQVMAAATAVAQRLGYNDFDQVWQSRSGPPQVPWLEPDICDHLKDLAAQDVRQVVVYPVGFISDHLEVVWDLDNEAAELAARLGMDYARADTVGADPRFIDLIVDLVDRYGDGGGDLDAMGCGDNGALCRQGCCAPPKRPPRP